MKENTHLWDRFCRLGEMIGDGLHNEPDGKWISKEYNRLRKILIPKNEADLAMIRLKNTTTNKIMELLLNSKKCECGGTLKQSRSGSKVAYCEKCNSRYKAKPSK